MKCYIEHMETSWDRFSGRKLRIDLHVGEEAVDIDWSRPVYITNDPPDQPQTAPPPTAKPDQGRAFDLGDQTK